MAKKSVKTHDKDTARVPGFNAEASLFTSVATYRSSGGLGGAIGAVQPALICGGARSYVMMWAGG